MQLYCRLIWVYFYCRFRARSDLHTAIAIPLRVLPNDLDINAHMNNSRYLALMDLGRVAFMIRTGLFKTALKRKWSPIVANIDISFYKSLTPWESFTLTTELTNYDEKYFYLKQCFWAEVEGKKRLAAEASVKGLFLSPTGKVSSKEVLDTYKIR